jgi:nitrate/nitrite transport system substrate-binding protein
MPEAAINYSRATHPDERQAAWFMANFRRWGMVEGPQDHATVARKVCRAELHEEALRELGLPIDKQPEGEIRLWDGTAFDAAKAEEYAKSFAIHALKG